MLRNYVKTCETCGNVYARSRPTTNQGEPEQMSGICAWCRAKSAAEARELRRRINRRATDQAKVSRTNQAQLVKVQTSLLDAKAAGLFLVPDKLAAMLADHLDWLIKAIASALSRDGRSTRNESPSVPNDATSQQHQNGSAGTSSSVSVAAHSSPGKERHDHY